MPITVKFKLEKETKGTFRYAEVETDGQLLSIGTLYIKKHILPHKPENLTVEIKAN